MNGDEYTDSDDHLQLLVDSLEANIQFRQFSTNQAFAESMHKRLCIPGVLDRLQERTDYRRLLAGPGSATAMAGLLHGSLNHTLAKLRAWTESSKVTTDGETYVTQKRDVEDKVKPYKLFLQLARSESSIFRERMARALAREDSEDESSTPVART